MYVKHSSLHSCDPYNKHTKFSPLLSGDEQTGAQRVACPDAHLASVSGVPALSHDAMLCCKILFFSLMKFQKIFPTYFPRGTLQYENT